jgi:hypothetical protein
MQRLLIPVLAVVLLSGCGDDEPAALPSPSATPTATATATTSPTPSPTPTASKQCVDLAKAVAVAHLAAGTPSEKVAEEVAESLDAKLSRLPAKVHTPAVDLHGHLHDLASALRKDRTTRAAELADKARADARAAAKACGMADAAFLG